MTNEGYRPFTGSPSTATFRLAWHDGFASLKGLGPDYDPLGPGGHGLSCD